MTSVKAGYPDTPLLEGDPLPFSLCPNSLQNNIPFSLSCIHIQNKFIPHSTKDRFTFLQKFLFRRLMSSLSLKPNRPQQPGIYRSPTGDLDESVLTDRRHGIVGGALTFSPAS